jgi:hypothetical protein
MIINSEENSTVSVLVPRVLAIISILAILLNCIPTFFWGDDFALYDSLKGTSLLDYAWNGYFHWDGRHLTLSGLVQTALIKYSNAPITTFFWAFSLVLFSYFLSKYFKIKKLVLSTGLISASLIFLFKSHAFQTVYGSTGGFYCFNLFLFGLWLHQYAKHTEQRAKWHLYFLCVLLGMTTQNLTICLLAIVAFDIAVGYWKTKKIDKRLILVFVLLLPSMALISFAPGNQIRLNSYPDVIYGFSSLFDAGTIIYLKAFLLSKFAFPSAAIFSLFLYQSGITTKLNLQHSVKYFLAALASLLPFVFIAPELFGTRTLIYFQALLFLSLIHFFSWVVNEIHKQNFIQKTLLNTHVITLFIVIQLLATTALSTMNLKSGADIKKDVEAREAIIYSYPKSSEVKVDAVTIPWGHLSYMHTFWDIQRDTSDWPNSFAAKYYGVKSISIK